MRPLLNQLTCPQAQQDQHRMEIEHILHPRLRASPITKGRPLLQNQVTHASSCSPGHLLNVIGYFPEEATGFIPGAQRAEPSSSGAVTPKTIHKAITGTDGKEEKLDPSMPKRTLLVRS
jgi:hypothetical protein